MTDSNLIYSARDVEMLVAEKTKDLLEEVTDQRVSLETICDYLMEEGGWSEIDGDGDEGSVIVQHISRLLHDHRSE